jgi:hypothetical protein
VVLAVEVPGEATDSAASIVTTKKNLLLLPETDPMKPVLLLHLSLDDSWEDLSFFLKKELMDPVLPL